MSPPLISECNKLLLPANQLAFAGVWLVGACAESPCISGRTLLGFGGQDMQHIGTKPCPPLLSFLGLPLQYYQTTWRILANPPVAGGRFRHNGHSWPYARRSFFAAQQFHVAQRAFGRQRLKHMYHLPIWMGGVHLHVVAPREIHRRRLARPFSIVGQKSTSHPPA